MTSFYTEDELRAMGFRSLGKGVFLCLVGWGNAGGGVFVFGGK